MGRNQSKPCCGVPERELRRVYHDRVQQLFRIQQAMVMPPDPPQEEIHIYCREDEVDQYLKETNTNPIVFHFKVGNAPETELNNSLEEGEKLGAAEISATVLEGRKVAEAGGDVPVGSEPGGGIVLGMGALQPELERTLKFMCQEVLDELHVQRSSRGPSERTKGHAVVEDLLPSSLASQPSVLSSGTQTRGPSFGAEFQNSGDVHPPHEDVILDKAWKTPCRTVLELATGDTLGTGEERTSGPATQEDASSEETLVDTDETLSDSGMTEERSGVKMDLGIKEAAEILLSLGTDIPRAASKPLPIVNKADGKVPEDDYNGGNVDAQLPKRAHRGTLATVGPEDETQWPVAAKIVRTRQSHWRPIHTLCKKTDVHVASDAEYLHSLPKDGAISMSKENQRQKSVVQNVDMQPPTGTGEMTGAVSSPKALRGTSETEQGGPFPSSVEPIVQISRNAQLSLKSLNISDSAVEDSAPSQRR